MEKLTLMIKEEKRLKIIQEVIGRERTVVSASEMLEVSERHCYRLLTNVRKKGARGIIHGNRGRQSRLKTPEDLEQTILNLRREKYIGFNDRHFTQELAEEEKIVVSRETVRKMLRDANIGPTKPVKKRKHRLRREPKPRFGEMLQGDASPHDWLEGRGPKMALVHFVDDAMGEEWAELHPTETTEGYFRVMMQILQQDGIPLSLYVDKHAIFRVNRDQTVEEQLSGKRPLTTFGRAMEELGVRIIFADSAPAKGRVERRGGLHQDRFVSELRLAGACTIDEANAVLKKHLVKNNRRFRKTPAQSVSAFRPLPAGIDLKQVLCWKEERTVGNDNTISFRGKTYQIAPSHLRSTWAKCKVMVHYCLDKSLHVFHKHERIACFKNLNVAWNDLPNDPMITRSLYLHSPTLTFSLGQ